MSLYLTYVSILVHHMFFLLLILIKCGGSSNSKQDDALLKTKPPLVRNSTSKSRSGSLSHNSPLKSKDNEDVMVEDTIRFSMRDDRTASVDTSTIGCTQQERSKVKTQQDEVSKVKTEKTDKTGVTWTEKKKKVVLVKKLEKKPSLDTTQENEEAVKKEKKTVLATPVLSEMVEVPKPSPLPSPVRSPLQSSPPSIDSSQSVGTSKRKAASPQSNTHITQTTSAYSVAKSVTSRTKKKGGHSPRQIKSNTTMSSRRPQKKPPTPKTLIERRRASSDRQRSGQNKGSEEKSRERVQGVSAEIHRKKSK